MSADSSAVRGVSAPETSDALWATDGLDLSTDESYDADYGIAQRPAGMCAEHHGRRRLRDARPMSRRRHDLSVLRERKAPSCWLSSPWSIKVSSCGIYATSWPWPTPVPSPAP